MASGERRPRGTRNESTFLHILGRESLAFSSSGSLVPFPMWKRFLWLGILCVLLLTCLVGVLVLAFSHFQSSSVRTTQIRTGALIGFGFLLVAVVAWSVFVYTKLGRSCAPRSRNDRRHGFRTLGASTVPPTPSSRSRHLVPATNSHSAAVSTRLENRTERSLAPAEGSTVDNINRNVSLVSQHQDVRVASGRFVLSHEVVPGSRVPVEVPRTLIDNRRTVRHVIESPPVQVLPSTYGPLSLQQGYIHHGYDMVRNNATILPPSNGLHFLQAPCREISRMQAETLQTHLDHCRLGSQILVGERSLQRPPPYRFQDHTSPPPAYDAIHITRRNTIYSEASNPPPYRSAPSSPVLSRHGDRETSGMSRCLTTSRSPLLHGEEDSIYNEDCRSFLSSSQLSLSQDGDVFVCETVSSLQRSISPLAQAAQSETRILSLQRVQYPGIPSPNESALHGNDNHFLGGARTSVSLDYQESLQQHDDYAPAVQSDAPQASGMTPPVHVTEGIRNGPVIYVYLGRTEHSQG